jgi:thiazole synthase/sulfur carrier protein
MNETIQVVVNGEARQVPPQLTVAGLLQDMGLDSGRVAIERNLEILPRARWQNTRMEDGDRFEIVQFVGGG